MVNALASTRKQEGSDGLDGELLSSCRRRHLRRLLRPWEVLDLRLDGRNENHPLAASLVNRAWVPAPRSDLYERRGASSGDDREAERPRHDLQAMRLARGQADKVAAGFERLCARQVLPVLWV